MEMTMSSDMGAILFNEPDSLTLDPKHPGINDANYVARRNYFFDTARSYRTQNKGIPSIDYTADEHEVWHHVSTRLRRHHDERACHIYLAGRDLLPIEEDHIPHQKDVSDRLVAKTGLSLVPAEGLIPFRGFFGYLAEKRMPCTQYVRHGSIPEFTPEPDVIHDMIGHVPPLADRQYVELIQMVGQATQAATDEQLLAFNRLYWFTIEFGLITENKQTKVFGAGLLSSIGEMKRCLSDEVTRLDFDMDKVITTDYDPSRMQDLYFVIPSFDMLLEETQKLVDRFERDRKTGRV